MNSIGICYSIKHQLQYVQCWWRYLHVTHSNGRISRQIYHHLSTTPLNRAAVTILGLAGSHKNQVSSAVCQAAVTVARRIGIDVRRVRRGGADWVVAAACHTQQLKYTIEIELNRARNEDWISRLLRHAHLHQQQLLYKVLNRLHMGSKYLPDMLRLFHSHLSQGEILNVHPSAELQDYIKFSSDFHETR